MIIAKLMMELAMITKANTIDIQVFLSIAGLTLMLAAGQAFSTSNLNPPGKALCFHSNTTTTPKITAVDRLEFNTILKETSWIIPPDDGESILRLGIGIQITNTTADPVQLTKFDSLYVNLADEAGNVYQRQGGRDRTLGRKLSDFPILEPGQSFELFVDAILSWYEGDLRLGGNDGFGGIWFFTDLNPGRYCLKVTYNNRQEVFKLRSEELDSKEPIVIRPWTGAGDGGIRKFEILEAGGVSGPVY